MSIVTVGPFKRIVDVHWGGELTVDLELNFWGESQDFFRCYEFTSIPEDAPEYWQPTYSPTRFASHIQLRPNKTAYASGYTTGVTSIFGENPGKQTSQLRACRHSTFSLRALSTACVSIQMTATKTRW